MAFRQWQAVEVTWVDAVTTNGWENEGSAEECDLSIIKTVGMLARDDKEAVTVVMSRSDGGEENCWLAIPRGMVKKIRGLR